MNRRLRAPSPALVISLIALFVALGGTSYAAVKLPTNSVGTKQLKKNAVTGVKIKNGAVTAAKINTKNLTVPNAQHATSATNATNASHATSADSAASATNASHATSATTATSATHATSATTADNATAVGGQTVKLIQWKVPPSTTTQTIFSANGLTITGACSSSSQITVDANGPTANNGELRIQGNVNNTTFVRNIVNFFNGNIISLVNGDAALSNGSAQLVYATADGHVLTLSYGWDFGNGGSGAYDNTFVGCTLYGEAVYR